MENVPVLGKLIEGVAHRDAVHIAVAPVVAGIPLKPGQHVMVVDGQAFATILEDCIGVVDPFLQQDVKTGQRFYLFLYPNTITSLRHVWSHPAFKTRVPGGVEAIREELKRTVAQRLMDEPRYGIDVPAVEPVALFGRAVPADGKGYDSGADLRNVK